MTSTQTNRSRDEIVNEVNRSAGINNRGKAEKAGKQP